MPWTRSRRVHGMVLFTDIDGSIYGHTRHVSLPFDSKFSICHTPALRLPVRLCAFMALALRRKRDAFAAFSCGVYAVIARPLRCNRTGVEA